MKKYALWMVALVIALVAGMAWLNAAATDKSSSGLRVDDIVIESASGQHSFKLEVAESMIDIQVGLMHRTQMDDDGGMIFLMGAEPRVTSFWMKNTLIPLDMIFVEKNGRIGHIHENAKPEDLTPISSQVPITAVIEINGGLAAKLGIATGDLVKYSYFE